MTRNTFVKFAAAAALALGLPAFAVTAKHTAAKTTHTTPIVKTVTPASQKTAVKHVIHTTKKPVTHAKHTTAAAHKTKLVHHKAAAKKSAKKAPHTTIAHHATAHKTVAAKHVVTTHRHA